MKKLMLIAAILLMGFSIFAQETKIEKTEFDKVMADSYKVLRNQSYRTIEESEYQSLSGTMKTKVVNERNGVNYRMIYESDSASSYTKNETIFFNGKRFKKTLNQPWVEDTAEIKSSPLTSAFETISNENSYFSLGEKVLNDRRFKVYKTVENRNQVNKEKGYETESNTITTLWFDETGLLVKRERLTESTLKPKKQENDTMVRKDVKSTTKSVTITEIDSNIKIEVPQIG